jgi:CRP/FNR family transcriptional regulator
MNAFPDVKLGLSAHTNCADCAIRKRAVCAYCGPTELAILDSIKSYRTFRPGEEIAAMGEETDFLGSVVTGVVSLSQGMEDGRRQMVGLLFPGDFIGRPLRTTAPFDAVAVSDVKLCIFMRSRFESLLRHTPDLERRLLEMALDELDAARDWMVLLGRKTAREKIASFLSLCARRAAALRHGEPEDGEALDLPLTREQIADYLGLTIETVSRQIGALKKEGVIDLIDARTLKLPKIDKLRMAAGEDV